MVLNTLPFLVNPQFLFYKAEVNNSPLTEVNNLHTRLPELGVNSDAFVSFDVHPNLNH